MAYHVNARFLRVMADLWSWVRACPAVAWLQVALCVLGLAIGWRRWPGQTALLALPALAGLALMRAQNLAVYPRYLIGFMPVYVFFCVLPLARLLQSPRARVRALVGIVAFGLFSVTATATLARLYRMERCGVRAAVQDFRETRRPGERLLGVLDGYVTVRYYEPVVSSGYSGADFWREIGSNAPPEYLISVPYQARLSELARRG